MSLNDLIYQDLIGDEGFESKPYLDTVGVMTFGYGFTYITKKEAEVILKNRVTECILDLIQNIPNYQNYPVGIQRALVNMRYQLGLEGLLKFKNTLRLIDEGKYGEAAKNALLSKWAQQTPQRAKRVTNWIKNA